MSIDTVQANMEQGSVRTNQSMWVCFLDEQGLETFETVPASDETAQELEHKIGRTVSTIQFWSENGDRITYLASDVDQEGRYTYTSLEELIAAESLSTFASEQLSRRLKAQPYNLSEPASAIYPLVSLVEDSFADRPQ